MPIIIQDVFIMNIPNDSVSSIVLTLRASEIKYAPSSLIWLFSNLSELSCLFSLRTCEIHDAPLSVILLLPTF